MKPAQWRLPKQILLVTIFLLTSLMASALPGLAERVAISELEISRYSKKTGKDFIIHLPKGIFFLSRTIKLPSNSIIEGEGNGTVLKFKEPFNGGKFITNDDHSKGNSNITIRSLAIEFNSTSLKDDSPGIIRFENVDNLHINNVTMNVTSSLFPIDLASHCRNAVIENCNITNAGIGGCVMVRNRDINSEHSTHTVTIRNNKFISQVTDEPIAVYGWLGEAHDINVYGNTIFASGASYGISAFGTEKTHQTGKLFNVMIRDNDIKGANTAGIGVKGGARNVQVLRNRIAMTAGDGVFIHAGGSGLPKVEQVIVRENTISDIGRHGVFATGIGVVIDMNRITNCKQSGVYVGDDVSVTNNVISNSSPGLYVEGTKNRIVRQNVLTNAPIHVLNGNWAGIVENEIRK